jgi:hypothetical protein
VAGLRADRHDAARRPPQGSQEDARTTHTHASLHAPAARGAGLASAWSSAPLPLPLPVPGPPLPAPQRVPLPELPAFVPVPRRSAWPDTDPRSGHAPTLQGGGRLWAGLARAESTCTAPTRASSLGTQRRGPAAGGAGAWSAWGDAPSRLSPPPAPPAELPLDPSAKGRPEKRPDTPPAPPPPAPASPRPPQPSREPAPGQPAPGPPLSAAAGDDVFTRHLRLLRADAAPLANPSAPPASPSRDPAPTGASDARAAGPAADGGGPVSAELVAASGAGSAAEASAWLAAALSNGPGQRGMEAGPGADAGKLLTVSRLRARPRPRTRC